MRIERRRFIRTDMAGQRVPVDVLLADSRRLIAEIDVLLEHSQAVIDRQDVLYRTWRG